MEGWAEAAELDTVPSGVPAIVSVVNVFFVMILLISLSLVFDATV